MYYIYLLLKNKAIYITLPGGSDGKESAYNKGDQGLIPGSGRSPREGNGYPLSILAWRTPWTEKTGGVQSMESQRVGHDQATNTLTTLVIYLTIFPFKNVTRP